MKKFDFHPLAREEYFDSLYYYSERSFHAGGEFLEEFEEGIQSVIKFPEAYKAVDKKYPRIRRYTLSQFPFFIIYADTPSVIYILAVAHHRRHPDYWKNRVKDIPSN